MKNRQSGVFAQQGKFAGCQVIGYAGRVFPYPIIKIIPAL